LSEVQILSLRFFSFPVPFPLNHQVVSVIGAVPGVAATGLVIIFVGVLISPGLLRKK
jgi:hypothetical protein